MKNVVPSIMANLQSMPERLLYLGVVSIVMAAHGISLEKKLAENQQELDVTLSRLSVKTTEADSSRRCQSDTTEWEQRIVKLKRRVDTLKTEVCHMIIVCFRSHSSVM